jgi:hypothetical protein
VIAQRRGPKKLVAIEDCPYLDFVVVVVVVVVVVEMAGQVLELLPAWFAALEAGVDPDRLEEVVAEAESVWIDQAVPGLESAEEEQDARVAFGQALGPWAAWFAVLEVDVFDPGLEAVVEKVSAWFVQGAPALVFAEQDVRVVPVQVLEP